MTSNRVDAPGYFPTNADEMRIAMGGVGTWSSVWRCDQGVGSLLDDVGTIDLTPFASPLYQQAGAFGGDLGVGFHDASTDQFLGSGGNYDIAAATSLALYICIIPETHLNRNFFGKTGGAAGYALQAGNIPTDGIAGFVSDGVTTVSSAVAGDHRFAFRDILFCIDRTNQRIQVFTDLGASTAADISAVGSPANGSSFFLGALTSIFQSRVAFAAVATGDIPNLRASGAEAIRSIRRFTGRPLP